MYNNKNNKISVSKKYILEFGDIELVPEKCMDGLTSKTVKNYDLTIRDSQFLIIYYTIYTR